MIFGVQMRQTLHHVYATYEAAGLVLTITNTVNRGDLSHFFTLFDTLRPITFFLLNIFKVCFRSNMGNRVLNEINKEKKKCF